MMALLEQDEIDVLDRQQILQTRSVARRWRSFVNCLVCPYQGKAPNACNNWKAAIA